MNIRSGLKDLLDHLGDLETAARKLKNQNFADVTQAARARVAQLHDHPDVDAVGEQFRTGHEPPADPVPFPGGEPDASKSGGGAP